MPNPLKSILRALHIGGKESPQQPSAPETKLPQGVAGAEAFKTNQFESGPVTQPQVEGMNYKGTSFEGSPPAASKVEQPALPTSAENKG